ncbi:MAG: HEAT repeat domain-containing protein [Planctomycetota bacterium]
MSPGFQTIKTQAPWYKKPGSLAALGVFVVLGAIAFFLLKGSEATLRGRVQAYDAISPVCAAAIGWRGLKEDATRDAFEQILATGLTDKPAPEEVRRACAYALGRAKQAHSTPYLVDALQKDPSTTVRCAAARAIGHSQEPLGAEALMAALNEHEGALRVAAAEGCSEMGDKRAIDPLIVRLDEALPEVRRACHDALVKLTGTSFEGIDEKKEWQKWRAKH